MTQESKCLTVVVDLEGIGSNSSFSVCEVCLSHKPSEDFIHFSSCGHTFCLQCVKQVFEADIARSKVDLECLRCAVGVSQDEVKNAVDVNTYEKYLSFSLRRYLAIHHQNVCHCLAPDCPFACINSTPDVPSQWEERNHFVCRREECCSEFCNSCKMSWHSGQSCEEFASKNTSKDSNGDTKVPTTSIGAKNCPSCGVAIEKQSDGSCNQVICTMCRTSFCWLCGKRVTEMHYLSTTGCPLYGTKMWTKRKRWCCRFWLWITAPLITILLAMITVPVVLIVFPLGIAIKVFKDSRECHKFPRILTVIGVTLFCVLLAPLLAVLASLIVFPLSLFYFYCLIPIHLCAQSADTQ